MYRSIITTFEKMIEVNKPIIYINDFDFVRVDELIRTVLSGKKIYEWNPATGTTNFENKNEYGNGKDDTLDSFLRDIYASEFDCQPESYVVLREIQDYIERPEVKTLLQLIAQRKLYDRNYNTTIIIVSSVSKIPFEIEKYVSTLELGFPSVDEINELIDSHIAVNNYDKTKFRDRDRNAIMPTLKGLTPFEIDRMLDMAMSSNGSLSADDRGMILAQKKSMVKGSGVLELIDSPASINDIGGYDELKDYLKAKSKVISRIGEAMKYGVAVPKGVFLVGMPGCGKSLAAKAASTLFNVPLLKMDMGSLLGKYVGDSEAKLRKAIAVAEAAAPCVLWIDEIEKAFSGIEGNSDVITRMFGYILSWMQDKTSTVYVIATANRADKLPPELKRKGRFDEIFCIDLPTDKERESIFDVKIKAKKKFNSSLFEDNLNIGELSEMSDGFNGADIESVVNEVVERSFLQDEKSLITNDDIVNVIKETKSISMSCKEDIENMRKIFEKSNFRSASKAQ